MSHDAEQVLMAAVLDGGMALQRVREIVSESDLQRPANQEIYRTLITLSVTHDRVDLVMLAEALQRQGRLAFVGGPSYLASISEAASFSENAAHYAGVVREASIRRRALEAMRLAAEALKRGAPLEEVHKLQQAVTPILDGVHGRVRETKGDTMRIWDRAAGAWSDGRPTSVKTGWSDFDAQLRLVNNIHAIGAHAGVGKSALVAGLVRQWTSARVKVGVLSYEDDAIDMQQRILACDSGLTLAELDGDAVPSPEAYEAAERAVVDRQLLEQYLLTDDAGRGTIAEALKSCREMHARGVEVLLLDNMSCVRLDAIDNDSHRLGVESALMDLRELAKRKLGIPIIVIGHLKSGQSDADELLKQPKLSDFAGGMSWSRTVRSACGMWWENNQVRLKVLKQTKGAQGGDFVVRMNASAATAVSVEAYVPPKFEKDETKPRNYSRRKQEAEPEEAQGTLGGVE